MGLLRSTPRISAPIAGASGLVLTSSERAFGTAGAANCVVLM